MKFRLLALTALCGSVMSVMAAPGQTSWDFTVEQADWNKSRHLTAIGSENGLVLDIKGYDSNIGNYNTDIDPVKYPKIKIVYTASGFPGKTNGEIFLNAKEPSIMLNYAAETKNIAQIAKWLKIKDKLSFNIDFINDFKTTGTMRLRSNDLTFSNMETKINNGKIDGGIVFALTEPKLTGYANINLDNINFDNFFPYSHPKEKLVLSEVLKSVKGSLENSFLLNDINFALKLNGHDITFKNLPMQQVSYSGKTENKNWTTEKLAISQAAMSNITYSGSVQKLADNSLYFKDVQIDLEMPKSLLLLDRLKIKSPIAENVSKVNIKTLI